MYLKDYHKQYIIIRKVRNYVAETYITDSLNKMYANILKEEINKIKDKLYQYYHTYKKFERKRLDFKLNKWILCGLYDELAHLMKTFLTEKINAAIKIEGYEYLKKFNEELNKIIIESEAYNLAMELYIMPFYPKNKFKKNHTLESLKYYLKETTKLEKLIHELILDIGIYLHEYENKKIIEKQIIYNIEDDVIYNSETIELIKLVS